MQGSKKEAGYIAKIILPMPKNDPKKARINIVAFDGASDVQKAADLIKGHFPAITVMQGIKHNVATIAGNQISLGPIKDLFSLLRR